VITFARTLRASSVHRQILTINSPQEQPLLLEDLLEQEKREQQQQHTAGPQQQQPLHPGDQPGLQQPGQQVPPQQHFEQVIRPRIIRTAGPAMPVPGIPAQGLLPPEAGNMTVLRRPPMPHPQQMQMGQMPQHPQQQWLPRHPQEVTLQQRHAPVQQNQQLLTQMSSPMMGGGAPGPAQQPPAMLPQQLNVQPPPQPPENPQTEEDKQKAINFVLSPFEHRHITICLFQAVIYEQWLVQQEQAIAQQLNYYETEINKLRKQKKVCATEFLLD
jgi:hypothetical protein